MYEPRVTGRTKVLLNEALSMALITGSPILLLFYWITYNFFDASLSASGAALLHEGAATFFLSRLPWPTISSLKGYGFWVVSQALLYHFLPGALHLAPRTPGGRRLLYRLNGLLAWFLTVAVAAAASYFGTLDPTVIAKQWGEGLATANVYALTLVGVFYVKARVRPDEPGDTLFTGECRTPYAASPKLTKRCGRAFLIRFYETLDGAHERFSFYSIYGFAAMMPQLWTLQTQYLAKHPVDLSYGVIAGTIALFALGWMLNHDANRQKSLSRQTAGRCVIWGAPAQFLEATYKTADGKTHRTVLLCSGNTPPAVQPLTTADTYSQAGGGWCGMQTTSGHSCIPGPHACHAASITSYRTLKQSS
ncbi:hypothetical protein CDD83_8503 [Cordyceps sp. RAO-2017]|nr:hypothetical protein CDD83_8503 [Cordyceps sp. RAO-2017]